MDLIKIGFCVAYDWHLLRYSLPLIYDHADYICLSIDKDRISWAGEKFSFDENSFKSFVQAIDKENKIKIFEENFHIQSLSPMKNEVRQRNLIADYMGKGGWHIQLDCDEYFLEFERFVHFLRKLPVRQTIKSNITCAWITLFKKSSRGFFYIPPTTSSIEFIQVATKDPLYEYGRRNGNFNLDTNFMMIHQSWARSEQEIYQKLNNWGHKMDFDIERYFNKWQSLNESNYREFQNFHPITPTAWPSLVFGEGSNIEDFIQKIGIPTFPLSRFELMLRNNRSMARITALKKKIFP